MVGCTGLLQSIVQNIPDVHALHDGLVSLNTTLLWHQ
jgi:hypothetical protein